jgi:hypothetical protein
MAAEKKGKRPSRLRSAVTPVRRFRWGHLEWWDRGIGIAAVPAFFAFTAFALISLGLPYLLMRGAVYAFSELGFGTKGNGSPAS